MDRLSIPEKMSLLAPKYHFSYETRYVSFQGVKSVLMGPRMICVIGRRGCGERQCLSDRE